MSDRYTAIQGPDNAWWWYVRDEKPGSGSFELAPPPLQEAEAKIIVFALNAVANGKSLIAADVPWTIRLPMRGFTEYDGPTESVAP